MAYSTLARALTNALNPFVIFTALYGLVALAQNPIAQAVLYVGLELLAAALVVLYVLSMRRYLRVGDFWISARAERLAPSVFLLAALLGLLAALALLGAPQKLFLLTLSMGLASATVALATLFFKVSAHCTVAGHAAVAGPLLLGLPGAAFLILLPAVIWARVAPAAHSLPQSLSGAAVGAAFAALLLR
jgi:hypothetical protein